MSGRRFDPTRASSETFLDRVVSRAAGMLLRSHKRHKRAWPSCSQSTPPAASGFEHTPVAEAVYQHLRTRDDNPCVVIPTAGGKTPIMATICKDAVLHWNGRVMILAHVKELLEQTADKLRAVCPEVEFGIYSAGLKRRDTAHPVIVAGIQSVYKRACELDRFDLVLVDESYLFTLEGAGMYRKFLVDAKVVNPDLRIVGFTATPFRLKTGSICTPEGLLNTICDEVGVRELIVQGYLCLRVTKARRTQHALEAQRGELCLGPIREAATKMRDNGKLWGYDAPHPRGQLAFPLPAFWPARERGKPLAWGRRREQVRRHRLREVTYAKALFASAADLAGSGGAVPVRGLCHGFHRWRPARHGRSAQTSAGGDCPGLDEGRGQGRMDGAE